MDISAFHSIFGKPSSLEGLLKRVILTSSTDLEILVTLSNFFRPKVFVEIGIWQGQTSNAIMKLSPWIEQYCGVDILEENCPEYNELKGHRDPITGKRLENKDPGFLAKNDPRFNLVLLDEPNGLRSEMLPSADMIFIDGAHDYHSVERDTKVAREALRDRKGVLIWHGFNAHNPEVMKFIYDHNSRNGNRITHVVETSVCFECVP